MPQIMSSLHPEPEGGTVAAETPESHPHLRRDGGALGEDRVQHLPRDEQLPRRLGNGEIECREHVLTQDLARMGRLHLGWLIGAILRHSRLLQWYCSRSTRRASPSSHSKVI